MRYYAKIYTLLALIYYNGGKNKMTKIQRLKNDMATSDRRNVQDQNLIDSRIKNDELTIQRRAKVDDSLRDHRLRNDEITANRREANDWDSGKTFAIFLLAIVVLLVGTFFVFL
jgi:hypothetical protein